MNATSTVLLAVALLTALAWGGGKNAVSAEIDKPLQVVVVPRQRIMSGQALAFRIVLRNVGDAPLLLNGGGVLGNGRHAWSAVKCTVQAGAGRPLPLSLHWGLGGVSGRVYVLGLVLGPGDTHGIEVTPDDYWVATALPVGKATLQCEFTGSPSDAAAWPATWVGTTSSAPVPIELTDGRPKA
jgi:hypothetical protein